MENRSHALAVGFFIIGFIVALLFAFRWLQGETTPQKIYIVTTETGVAGLNNSSDVRVQGLTVGKIQNFYFDPTNRKRVLIKISVNDDIPVTTGTYATIVFQGITGQGALALEEAPGSHPALTSANDRPPNIPMRPSAIENAAVYIRNLYHSSTATLERLQTLLSDDNLAAFSNTLKHLETASETLPELASGLQDSNRELQTTLASIDRFVEGDLTQTIGSYRSLSEEARQTLQQTNATVAGLSEGVQQDIFPQLNQSLTDLRKTMRHIDRLVHDVSQNPSTLLRGAPRQAGPGEDGFDSKGNTP